ncbi:MAG: MBL fold metallo-hydrolase [Chloroflexi bacterium]|nr:MBL fold metallo-hydrolase [Chloroflexota bacterium]
MQRLSFGAITVDAFSDGELAVPLAGMFPGADIETFRPFDGVDDSGNMSMPMTTFVIRTAGKLVLVDTGIGPELGSLGRAGFAGDVGYLPGALKDAGIDANAVDTVVFTHLHADHIGWNVTTLDGEAVPTFPNASYVVTKTEWAYWSGTKSRDIARCVRPLEERGQLLTVDDGYEPAPGLSLVASPGHTPGHTCVLVGAGSERGLITGDAAHHPAELVDDHFVAVHDMDPARSTASRAALAARMEAEGLTVLGGHFPPPGAGNLVRVDAKRQWRWLGA